VAKPKRKDDEQDPEGHNPEFERFESLLRVSKEVVEMSRAERARHKREREEREHRRAGSR
jgi:hypothetical protein